VRAADGLVFISETTRQAFVEHYPRSVGTPWVVAWHGRDPSWDGGDERGPDPAWRLHDRPFLLHVGHRDGYKNFATALEAYAASDLSERGVAFVVVGPPFTEGEALEIGRRGHRDHVVWRPAPNREELRRFVSSALALVYVSRDEGFGMPLIEAMQCRTPVIAADASCLPEVAGGAAILVPPDDVGALASSMQQVTSDAEMRGRLVAAGRARAEDFTWEQSARHHLALYEQLAGG